MRLLLAAAVFGLVAFIAIDQADCQTPPVVDPKIQKAVDKVEAARLKADDLALVGFGTRSTFSETAGASRGAFAARAWIEKRFKEIAARTNGRMTVAFDSHLHQPDGRRIVREVEISNVVATLRGDEPGGRTYVISGHYDSRNSDPVDGIKDAPGADDDASGVVAVLEAARVMADLPLHATVIFVAFEAEEQGLLGAAHFAQALKDSGTDVQGDLNNDIIGASVGPKGESNPGKVRIFSEALPLGAEIAQANLTGSENDSPSRELARYAKETGERYVPGFTGELINRMDRFLRGGDHSAFNHVGFPAIRFVEPVENYVHQHQDVRVENGVKYGDLPEFVDFDYLARVTKFNVAVLANLAMAPGRPQAPVIETKELTNDTTLNWAPVASAVAYEIVTRATTDAFWRDTIPAGNVNHVTLPISKDNTLFAIRSVDAEGHRSVAAFPVPQR